MAYTYAEDGDNLLFKPIEAYIDPSKSIRFINDELSSINFDGLIPSDTASIAVSDVIGGYYLGVYDNATSDYIYYPIIRVEREDPDGPGYTGYHEIFYLQDSKVQSSSYSSSADVVIVVKELWDQKDIGTSGWLITQQGNAIFSNVAVRGDLEATTLDVGGANGIIYDGASVVIGTDVIINASLTVNSLTVGTSPTLLQISDNVNGTNDGIYIDSYNYWYSDGQFGVGGSAGSAKWTGSALSITGNINATSGAFTGSVSAQTITASNGIIAGFTLENNQLSASQVILSSSGGLRLGATNQFSVDQNGNLVATSASITGNITANSGTFTGSISALTISASTGSVGGFLLSASSITSSATGSYVGITTGASAFFAGASDRLGTGAQYYVTSTGSVFANAASISGNINATSGSFTGDITANAGRFNGSVTVGSAGGFIAGDLNNGVVLNASGLTGYNAGFTMFNIPVTGSPTIAGFTVINTGLTGSGQYANIIAGTASNGIIIRGDRATSSAAIYTAISGSATTATTGNGFYVDELGRFRLAGSNGSLTFDGNNLSITGSVTAQAGTFTGSVSAQHITASTGSVGGWNLSSNALTGGTGDNTVGLIPNAVTNGVSIYAGSATIANAPFRVTNSGSVFATNASITGNINATGGRFDGHLLFGQSGTSSVSVIGYNLNDSPAAQPSASGTEYGFKLNAYNYWINKQLNLDNNDIFLLGTATGDDYIELDDFGTLTFQATGLLNPGSELGGWTVGNGILYTGAGTTFNAISAGDSGGTFASATISIENMIIDDEFYTYFDPNFIDDEAKYSTIYIRAIYSDFGVGYSESNFGELKEFIKGSKITFSGFAGTDGASLNYSNYNLEFVVAEVIAGSFSLQATASTYTVGGLSGTDKRVTLNQAASPTYVTLVLYGEDASPSALFTGSTRIDSSTAYAHDPSAIKLVTGGVTMKGDLEITSASTASFTYYTFKNTPTNAFIWAGNETPASANLLITTDGNLILRSENQSKPDIFLYSTGDYVNASTLNFRKVKSTVAVGDDIGNLDFRWTDSESNNYKQMANILVEHNTDSASVARLIIRLFDGGTSSDALTLTPSALFNGTIFAGNRGTYDDRVGINTSTPASALHVAGQTYLNGNTNISGTTILTGAASAIASLYVATTASIVGATQLGSTLIISGAASANTSLYVGTTASLVGATQLGSTLTVSGNASANSAFYVGGTASIVTAQIATASVIRNGGIPLTISRIGQTGGSEAVAVQFVGPSGNQNGRILFTDDSITAPRFVAGSDYRLKENIKPLIDSIDRIKKAKVYSYNPIGTSETNIKFGFIAHEAAEIMPNLVIGEKDAIDEDGNPVYQQIGEATLIPILTAALKDSINNIEKLCARIDQLENRIQELENKNV